MVDPIDSVALDADGEDIVIEHPSGRPIVGDGEVLSDRGFGISGTGRPYFDPGAEMGELAHHDDYHAAPWITDTANKFRYSIHYYFDVLSHNSGSYTNTYAAEVANSIANGF